MASIGHVLVGVAAARLGRPPAASFFWWALGLGALSLLPDVDVLGFKLGVAYAAPWGHRGATHSLLAALIGGLLVGLAVARLTRASYARSCLVCTLVLATHPLLDALTDGGLGVALLWPSTHHRYFASWRPLPVAPIGPAILSARGLRVIALETLWFLPVAAVAFWPRRRHKSG